MIAAVFKGGREWSVALNESAESCNLYNGGLAEDRERMRAEAVQCGAMALRFLLALETYEHGGKA